MEGRPPRPPSGTRRGGAKSPLPPGDSPEASAEYAPAATGSLRRRSPSPTPHKRSSSLSRTGRDPLINPVGGTRLRSASPSSRPGTQQRGQDADPVGASGGTLPPVVLAACGAESSMRRGSEVLLALERLSGSESPGQVVMGVREMQPDRSSPAMPGGKTLGPMSAAGISSRLRLAHQTSSNSAGLQTVGSLTVGSLGASPVDGRQAGRGIALRVGHVNTSPAGGTKLRVGGAPGAPKIAPSTLVATRLFGELKEQAGSSRQLPKPAGQSGSRAAATRHGRTSPRTAVWASEIRAASIRFDQGAVDPEQRTGSAGTSDPKSHLPAAQDPWVALERLRLKPESPEFVYMIPYRRSEGVWRVPHTHTHTHRHTKHSRTRFLFLFPPFHHPPSHRSLPQSLLAASMPADCPSDARSLILAACRPRLSHSPTLPLSHAPTLPLDRLAAQPIPRQGSSPRKGGQQAALYPRLGRSHADVPWRGA